MILDKNRAMKSSTKHRSNKKKITHLQQFYKPNNGKMYLNYDSIDLYFRHAVSILVWCKIHGLNMMPIHVLKFTNPENVKGTLVAS